jgi:hypothetical protein
MLYFLSVKHLTSTSGNVDTPVPLDTLGLTGRTTIPQQTLAICHSYLLFATLSFFFLPQPFLKIAFFTLKQHTTTLMHFQRLYCFKESTIKKGDGELEEDVAKT